MPRAPKRIVALSAKADDETFSQQIDVTGYTHIVAYMIANGTVTSGAVTFLEGCIDPDTDQPYSGTWVTIGSAVTAPTTGIATATHFTVGAYSHLQVRISTAIGGGGSVTVILLCCNA